MQTPAYFAIPPGEGGKNMLTNKKDGSFTISEIEVWGFKELEQ